MLLRHHASLGSLPETIVLAFLAAAVVALGSTTVLVLRRTPVLLVADAGCCGRVAPACADDAYLRSFASDFLTHWETWTCYSCAFRQAEALGMLAPSLRASSRAQCAGADALRGSLQQSQHLELSQLTISRRDEPHGLYDVAYAGTVTVFFGGVGGGGDACHGHLVLHTITPTAANPLCLEVVGFSCATRPETPP